MHRSYFVMKLLICSLILLTIHCVSLLHFVVFGCNLSLGILQGRGCCCCILAEPLILPSFYNSCLENTVFDCQ